MELPRDLLHLPQDMKHRVATFLSPQDAVTLGRSCRTMYDALALARLDPERPLFATFVREGAVATGDTWYRAFSLPVFSRRVHSMQLKFFWRDQDWGNRKTECRIVGYPVSLEGTTTAAADEIPTQFAPGTAAFGGGRVVASSTDYASHHEERLTLSFNPLDNEKYHFWYKVGGGGGHEMFLRDGRLHTVIFDDEFRNYTRNYRVLVEQGLLCSREVEGEARLQVAHTTSLLIPRMLITVSRMLRRHLQEQQVGHVDELLALLAEYSIPVNVGSLVALEEIVQADMEERLEQRNDIVQ